MNYTFELGGCRIPPKRLMAIGVLKRTKKN